MGRRRSGTVRKLTSGRWQARYLDPSGERIEIPFEGSLDMHGISITLMPLDDEQSRLWDAPVRTPALTW